MLANCDYVYHTHKDPVSYLLAANPANGVTDRQGLYGMNLHNDPRFLGDGARHVGACDNYWRNPSGFEYALYGGRLDDGMLCGMNYLGVSSTELVHRTFGACDLYKLDKPNKVVTWFVGGSFIQYGIEIGCFCLNDNEIIQADAGVGACIVIISLIDIEIRYRI